MQIVCLSVSYHNTPVEFREALNLSDQAIEDVYSRYPVHSGEFIAISELVILSTCNRLEIYVLVTKPGLDDGRQGDDLHIILAYLFEALAVPENRLEPYVRVFTEIKAVEHLFRVASGLDSIALGETQILGQVSRALETALRFNSTRHVLSSLFRSAIHTGKRVHSETGIGRQQASIAILAAQFVETKTGPLARQNLFVVGAGKIGGDAVRALFDRGAISVSLSNRTYQRGVDFARQFGDKVVVRPFEQLADGLALADVVITSTAAQVPIIRRELLAAVMQQRAQKRLIILDLSVPRNVEAIGGKLEDVALFDMDDLQAYAKDQGKAETDPQISFAEGIVAEEVTEYEKLWRIIPFIGELHRKVERIRQQEVERALRFLHHADPEMTRQIELFSRSLVRKILHEPTMHLRTESNQETLNDYVDTLSRLFDLVENGGAFQGEDTTQNMHTVKNEASES